MKKLILSLWIFVSCLALWLHSDTASSYGYQTKHLQGEEDPFRIWKHFTPTPFIEDVAFEGNYIWAATQNGVVRWNLADRTFDIFTTDDGLADNWVLSVIIDNFGNKWFGTTSGGVSKFDGSTWTTYTTANGLPSNTIITMTLHPNGTLLMGTPSGVTVFDGNTFSSLPPGGPSSAISAIAVDNSLNIWVGTYSSGTYKLSGTTWQMYGDVSTGPGGSVRDIAVSPTGDVWFAFEASFNGSVGRFSGTTWTRYTMADGLISNTSRSIDVSSSGLVWAGFSQTNGVAIFNGNSWITGSIPYARFGITTVRASNSGEVAITDSGQLMVFDGTRWETYLTGPPMIPLLGSPQIATAPNGDVWFGVYAVGAVRYDGNSWELYDAADGLYAQAFASALVDHTGNVWFSLQYQGGGWNGVVRFDGTSWTHFTIGTGLPSHIVYALAVDGNNNVWFATREGLARYDGVNWQTYTTADGLATNWISNVNANGEEVWVAYSAYSGSPFKVGHFDGNTWTNYSTADGLPNGSVSGIDFDSSGNVWIGIGDSITEFDGTIWTNYPLTIDPPVLHTTDLVVDANDDVWVGAMGNNGPTGINLFSNGTWTNFTVDDGMLSNQISDIAIDATRNTLWFSMSLGVTRLQQFYGLDESAFLPLVRK